MRRNLVSINFPRQATRFGRNKRRQLNLASTYPAPQSQKVSIAGSGEVLLTLPLSGEIEPAYIYVAKSDDLKEGREGEPSRRRAISHHNHRSFLFLGYGGSSRRDQDQHKRTPAGFKKEGRAVATNGRPKTREHQKSRLSRCGGIELRDLSIQNQLLKEHVPCVPFRALDKAK